MKIGIVCMISLSLSHAKGRDFSLINASTIEEAKTECISKDRKLGTFKSYKFTPTDVFKQAKHVQRIWNGYIVETDYLDNTGCYERKQSSTAGNQNDKCYMSVAFCWAYCKSFHPQNQFAIRYSECSCIPSNHVDVIFRRTNASFCAYICEDQPAEYCGAQGGKKNVYNIYSSVPNPVDTAMNTVMADRFCLFFNTSTNTTDVTDCRGRLKHICRGATEPADGLYDWSVSTEACISPGNSSYMVSHSDVTKLNLSGQGLVWLNERIYNSTIDPSEKDIIPAASSILNNERCEVLLRNGTKEIVSCTELTDVYFLCLSKNVAKDTCQYDGHTTTAMTAVESSSLSSASTQLSSSPSSSINSVTSSPSSVSSILSSTTESSSSMEKSFELKKETGKDNKDGVIIGTVTAVSLLLISGTVIIILIYRRRTLGKEEDDNIYHNSHEGKVKSVNPKCFNNSAYCAEGTLDIIRGHYHSDRNSQDTYMTIPDGSPETEFGGTSPLAGSPPILNKSCEEDAHGYFILSPKKNPKPSGESHITSSYDQAKPISISPYDLAKSVALHDQNAMKGSGYKVDEKGKENESDNVDYDHLNHEVCKDKIKNNGFEEENAYSHGQRTDIDISKEVDTDTYSHTNRGHRENLKIVQDENDYNHINEDVYSIDQEDNDDYSYNIVQ